MIYVRTVTVKSAPEVLLFITSLNALVTMATSLASAANYDGFQVFRVRFADPEKWSEFYTRLPSSTSSGRNKTADIWRYSKENGYADILLNVNQVSKAEVLLQELRLPYHVTIPNVGRLVDEDLAMCRRKRSIDDNDVGGRDVIGRYARYAEMLEWMRDIATHYPTITKLIDIGLTQEGRQMKILKIGLPGRNKWKVWIDGGTHAREWISPATVLYLANELLRGYLKKDNSTTTFLQKLDFYFLPVVNPDGYEYSQTKDRLWRKSRKLDKVTGCHGTDLNRNWRFQWGTGFSSTDPCAEDFRGNSPEDSVEVRNIVDFLSPRAGAFMAFLTYHSYGQRFITRWDYSNDVVPNDHDQLMALAKKAVSAMYKVHGTEYVAGRAPELMYPYGGGSADWARAISNIKYSYLIELRDQHSFVLSAEEIVPTGEENWAALQVISRDILLYYGDIPAPHASDRLNWSPDNEIGYGLERTGHDKLAVIYSGGGASGVIRRNRRGVILLLAFVALVFIDGLGNACRWHV